MYTYIYIHIYIDPLYKKLKINTITFAPVFEIINELIHLKVI